MIKLRKTRFFWSPVASDQPRLDFIMTTFVGNAVFRSPEGLVANFFQICYFSCRLFVPMYRAVNTTNSDRVDPWLSCCQNFTCQRRIDGPPHPESPNKHLACTERDGAAASSSHCRKLDSRASPTVPSHKHVLILFLSVLCAFTFAFTRGQNHRGPTRTEDPVSAVVVRQLIAAENQSHRQCSRQ